MSGGFMAKMILQPERANTGSGDLIAREVGLGVENLIRDANWFTHIRWWVVLALGITGMAGHFLPDSILTSMGIALPCLWLIMLSVVLAVINVISVVWLQRVSIADSVLTVSRVIWFQIVSDLIVLALLVYRMGPLDTPIAFTFLFHIVLACIFFDRHESLRVTLLSMVLFLSAVVLSECGVLPRHSILAFHAPDVAMHPVLAFATVMVWVVVWHLASFLSRSVRQQDHELSCMNARLQQADSEKNQQMLRVTHDLKAPFAGMESSIHVLRQLHWNGLPEAAKSLIERIEANSRVLRGRIGEILTLGSLRSDHEEKGEELELLELLNAVVEELQGLAESRHVTVVLLGEPKTLTLFSDPHQLVILFRNLISNAILYSQDGGRVEIGVSSESVGRVWITDHGIGISAEALPQIFDDFYRSEEAASFNPKSNGLGLALVRQIAQNLRLAVEVDSTEGAGTTFRIQFPH
jgi:two-component system phosphate regulon sensor histidine kinase PhoR